MDGSEKQIKWATEIQANLVSIMAEEIEDLGLRIERRIAKGRLDRAEQLKEALARCEVAQAWIAGLEDASLLIHLRYSDAPTLVREHKERVIW